MSVSDWLSALLGDGSGRVERVITLGRSHEWTLHRAVLCDGRQVFAKAAAQPHGALRAERDGLRCGGGYRPAALDAARQALSGYPGRDRV